MSWPHFYGDDITAELAATEGPRLLATLHAQPLPVRLCVAFVDHAALHVGDLRGRREQAHLDNIERHGAAVDVVTATARAVLLPARQVQADRLAHRPSIPRDVEAGRAIVQAAWTSWGLSVPQTSTDGGTP